MFGSTYDKSLPYLKHTSDKKIHSLDGNGAESGCAYKLTFWGVNPEVAAQIIGENDLADIRSFFSVTPEGGVPDVVSSEEYSRYEISCYEALYCIALKDVPKFLESGDSFGVFYENYATRVTRMAKDSNKTAVTPHLDIRWHRRCHVPMIGDDKNREDDKRVARAIWLALIYGGLPEATVQGRKAVYAVFNATADKKAVPEQKYPSREILLKGKHIRVTDAYELYKALQVDEITTLRFIEVYEKSLANDMETGLENKDFVGPRARRFAKKLISADEPDRNALNILARFVAHAKATDEERAIFTEALLELIDEFCSDLTEERQIELRKHILKASRFAIKTSKAKKTDSDKKDDGGKKTTAVSKATNNRARVERHINFDYWEGK